MIPEWKIDSTPKEVISQRKDKKHMLRFLGKMGETPKCIGRILAVGSSYERKSKEHFCKVEALG